MNTREAGYYKVRFNDGDWILAMWFFNYWLIPGSDKNFADSYFKEINEKMVVSYSLSLTESQSNLNENWVSDDRARKMRNDAVNIFELTKGFTTEPNSNAMKAALDMAGYVLELTGYLPLPQPPSK